MPTIEQQVRERAYHIWEDEGRVFERAVEHWLRAEAECRCDSVTAPADASAPLVVEFAESMPGDVRSPAKTLKPRSARPASAAALAVAAKAEAAVRADTKTAASAKPPASKTKSAKTGASKTTPSRAKASTRSAAGTSAVLH